MLNSVGGEVPSDDIAQAVFYLIKDVGLSHREIFGSTEVVNTPKTQEREGAIGTLIDRILGKKEVQETEKVDLPGMNIRTLDAYMNLLSEHNEEKEKQHKKQKMRQTMRGTPLG
jgi:hypothetical protein